MESAVQLDIRPGDQFWSSTSDGDLSRAWAMDMNVGSLSSEDKKAFLDVKCVGVIIK